jgi:hypothetical protein
MNAHYPNIYNIEPPFEQYYEIIDQFAISKSANFEIDDHTSPPLQLFIRQQGELNKTIHISAICEQPSIHDIDIKAIGFSMSAYYDKNNVRYLYSKKIKIFDKMPSLKRTVKILNYCWDELIHVKKEDLTQIYQVSKNIDY